MFVACGRFDVEEIIRGAIGIGRHSHEQCSWWSRVAAVWGEEISMSPSSVTQLGPTEKDNMMRCKCGFCKRTGLSKNNFLARYDGAFLPLRHELGMRHLQELRQQLLQRLRTGRVEEESRSERGEAGGVQCQYPRFGGHFRIDGRGNTTAKRNRTKLIFSSGCKG